MTYYSGTGLNVTTQFGPRQTGAVLGAEPSAGPIRTLEVVINAEGLNSAGNAYLFYPKVYLPKGATVTAMVADTKSAFTMTGTTPTILIGTKGSEVTNGAPISSTQASTVSHYSLTPVGTWAAVLAADTQIGVAFGGTTPVVTVTGEIRVLITYQIALP